MAVREREGWARGRRVEVSFAAWIPATRATARASPLARAAVVSAA